MKHAKWLTVLALLFLVIGCGGGGGGGNSGGGGAVSGHVPYLLSAPSVSYRLSTFSTSTAYDVTVTLHADGPTGVYDASLWIFHATNPSIFTSLTLTYTGTKTWSATTYWPDPLPPGQYYIDDIVLDDGDPFTANPLRTGWYIIDPLFSSNKYFVDERETTNPPTSFLFYNAGLSGLSVTRFTLP